MDGLSGGSGSRSRALRIITPGLLTTVQDEGRWGWQASGVPVAGPMDPASHRMANALVGNDRRAATLEVTLLGPEIEFEDERLVAVVGAEFELSVDRRPAPSNAAFIVMPGSRLLFGDAPRRRKSLCGRLGRRRRAADSWQPRHESRVSHGRLERPCVETRRSIAARRCERPVVAPVELSRAALRAARQSRRRFACCRVRRQIISRQTRSTAAVGAVRDRPGLRSHGVSPVRAGADARARRRHHLRRDAARCAASARLGAADSADGRPPDNGWISENRHRHLGGYRRWRPARASRPRRVRGLQRRARRWRP